MLDINLTPEILATLSPEEIFEILQQHRKQQEQQQAIIENLQQQNRNLQLDQRFIERERQQKLRAEKEKQRKKEELEEQIKMVDRIHEQNLKFENELKIEDLNKTLLAYLVEHGSLEGMGNALKEKESKKEEFKKITRDEVKKFVFETGYTRTFTTRDMLERQIRFLKLMYKETGDLDFIERYLDFLYKGKSQITKTPNVYLNIILYIKSKSEYFQSYRINSNKADAFRMYVLSCVVDSFVIPEKTAGEYNYIVKVEYENLKVCAYEVKEIHKDPNLGAFFPFWIRKIKEDVEFEVGRSKIKIKPEEFNSLALNKYQLYFERTYLKTKDKFTQIKEEARWPCLWFSLMQCGVSLEELNKVRKFIVNKTGEVERAKLGKIGNTLKLKIRFHHIRENKENPEKTVVNVHETGDKTSERVIEIGLYLGHYFKWEDIKFENGRCMNVIRFLKNCEKKGLLKPYTENEKENMDVLFNEIFEEELDENDPRYCEITASKIDIFCPNFNILRKDVELNWIDKDNNRRTCEVNMYKEIYTKLTQMKKNESQNMCDELKSGTFVIDKFLIQLMQEDHKINIWDLIKKEPKLRYGACSDRYISSKPRWFNQFTTIGCFDLETYQENETHKFLTGCFCLIDSEDVCKYGVSESYEKMLVKSFNDLNEFFDNVPNNSLLYAHNLKFDYNFLFDVTGWKAINQVKKDGNLYEITFGLFEEVRLESKENEKEKIKEELVKKITFRDSLKIISMPLRDFHKSFNLSRFIEVGKEYCNYEFYNIPEHRDINFTCDSSLYSDKIPHQENFNPMEYLDYYCQQDVKILMLGLLAFREDILSLELNIPESDFPVRAFALPKEFRKPKLEIFDYLSSASFAQEYFVVLGAYEGVKPVCGSNLNFAMKAMIGGRTVCSTRKSQRETKLPVVALDAVSLYPTAMSQIPGYPIGNGKIWNDENKDKNVNTVGENTYGIFEVEILEMENKEYSLPAFRYRNDKQQRRRENKEEIDTECEETECEECVGEKGVIWDHGNSNYVGRHIIADSITLKDYEMLYGLKYKIIKGLYWTEFNTKVNSIIQDLFQKRLIYKKQGNKGLSNVVKLIMNSAYGKNLIKPNETEEKVYSGKRDANEHFGPRFLEQHEINKSRFVKIKSCVYHQQNFAHLGVMILSQSKHYMNRLLHLSTKDSIFYQDTDSYHILRSEVKPLEEKYRAKYKKELCGDSLGQFHIDYDFDKPLDTLYSDHSIYVCPKVYAERIKCDIDSDFDEIFFRCKGVPGYSIEYRAKEMGMSIMEIYGSKKVVKFDLLEGRANIKIGKAGFVEMYREFKRDIQMNAEKNCEEEFKNRKKIRGF